MLSSSWRFKLNSRSYVRFLFIIIVMSLISVSAYSIDSIEVEDYSFEIDGARFQMLEDLPLGASVLRNHEKEDVPGGIGIYPRVNEFFLFTFNDGRLSFVRFNFAKIQRGNSSSASRFIQTDFQSLTIDDFTFTPDVTYGGIIRLLESRTISYDEFHERRRNRQQNSDTIRFLAPTQVPAGVMLYISVSFENLYDGKITSVAYYLE